MTTGAWHVGLVRAVMQGREGLTGDVLRAALADAGGHEGRTYRSTGNVVFRAVDGAAVCDRLATAITEVVGRDTPVLHRTATSLRSLVAATPFADAPTDAAEQVVVFTADALDEDEVRAGLPGGTGLLLVHEGRDACCWRAATDGPHPMPAIEAFARGPVTSRSGGTVEGLVSLLDRHG